MRRLNALRSGYLFYSLEIDFYSQLSNEGWKLVEVREESTNNEHIEPL